MKKIECRLESQAKNVKKNKKAFSLIELLVTIAIIGVLSAIAIPSYKNYLIKAKVAKRLAELTAIKNAAIEEYKETGFIPEKVKIGNFNIPKGMSGNVNDPLIVYIKYYADENSMTFSMLFDKSLGIPKEGNIENYSINMRVKLEDNIARTFCGYTEEKWHFLFVPMRYLPSSCRCFSINTDPEDCSINTLQQQTDKRYKY